MTKDRIFAACAGACDATTGGLLVAAPEFTLRLMMIPGDVAEPVFVRFIGAFVFAIGSSYFLPYLQSDPLERSRRFVAMFELTMLVRICIASFSLAAIIGGALHVAWISVFLTDASLATAQGFILRYRKLHP